MPRETMAAGVERALEVARRMNEHYPAAECARSCTAETRSA